MTVSHWPLPFQCFKLTTALPLQLRFPESNSRPLGQEQENEPAELWHECEQPPLEYKHSSISERYQVMQSEHPPPGL